MLLDLAILKVRLGIDPGDTDKDALITQVAEQAQALAETYTDRKFDLEAEDESFPGVTRSLQVHRYPIVSIEQLSSASDLDEPPAAAGVINSYRVDAAKGLVWPSGWGRSGFWPLVRVQYTGGYLTAPVDLLWALTSIFDIIWGSTPGGGLEPGASGGAMFDAVKRFSVVGAYSVELGSTGDSGGGGGDGDNNWGILTPAETAVLDRYRRGQSIGIG